MSSELSCDYCSMSPRHPCYSREEAAVCPNQDNPGSLHDFDPTHVAEWIRHRAKRQESDIAAKLEEAASYIERHFI